MVIIQSAILLFGIFVSPLSESRSEFYVKFMPEIKHYSILVAELVFPVVIFFLSMWGILS